MSKEAYGLVGVVLGFILKAAFDLVTESRRQAREDRFRFVQERMRLYTDILFMGQRIIALGSKALEYDEARESLEKQVDELVLRHGHTPEDQEIPEAAGLPERVEALQATVTDIRREADERVLEIQRTLANLLILAPPHVQQVAIDLVEAVTAEDRDEEAYSAAIGAFRVAARSDLGHG